MTRHHLSIYLTVTLTLLLFGGCIRKKALLPMMEINLFSGVQDFVKIGDSESLIVDKAKKYEARIVESPREAASDDRLSFSRFVQFKDQGMKIYYRNGRVVLIALQEPFRGNIQGRRLTVFNFTAPTNTTWDDLLLKEFGTPLVKASGGRFGAEAFFYSWGDISFNRMGPNELAIYRERDISLFRQKNFGREVNFFPE